MGRNGKGRVGGLRVDPAAEEWLKTAAENAAALTKKQRADRKRCVVKYDLPPGLKQRIENIAKEEQTTASQLAAFLLGWAMDRWEDTDDPVGEELRLQVDEAKVPSRSMRVVFNLSPNPLPGPPPKRGREFRGNEGNGDDIL